MASFTPSGVEFVAKGLSGYLGDLNKANDAQQALGKSVAGIGSSFTSAQSGVASFASTVGGSTGAISGFVSSLGQMAIVAGGNILASAFESLAGGVRDFASAGLEAVSHAQTLEASLGALLVQNNLYTQTTESMSVAVGNLAEMQAEAAAKSDDLAFKQRELTADINTQNASIQEQRQRIMQMADGLDKNQQVARLQEMEIALEGMNRELASAATEQGKLNNITQEYTTVTKTSWQQVMDMTDAQSLAKEQTKELLGFIEKLAIVSPFEQEDVEKVTQYAIGAGLGVEATEDFTAGFLDLAAAVGITSPNLDEAAYQLLQVKKAGKLTAIDLRQLSTRGIDLAKIIGVQMGMSVDEFNDKAEKTPAIFDDLIQAVTDYSKNTFAGTSEAMSTSIEGFRSTVSDLFTQSAKKVLRPLVDAVTPTVAEMISVAADFITGGQAEQIGQMLADGVMTGFSTISESVGKMMSAFDKFGIRGASTSILGQLGFSQDAISEVNGVIATITGAFNKISQAYDNFGARGAATSILGQLGMSPEMIGTIRTTIDTIVQDIGILQTVFSQFGAQGAGVSLLSMLGLSPESIGLITTGIQTVMDSFAALSDWWTTNWPVMQAVAMTAWEVLQGIFAGIITALGPVLSQLQTQFGEIFTQLGQTLAGLGISWSDVWNSIVTATQVVAVVIGAVILGIIGVIAGLATGVASGISATIGLFQSLSDNVSGIITGLITMFSGWVITINALLSGDFAGAWEGFKVTLQGAYTFWTSMWSGMLEAVLGVIGIIASTIGGFVQGIVGFFQGMYDELIGNSIIPDLINGIVKWFKDLPQKIFNALGDLKTKVTAPFADIGRIVREEVMQVLSDFIDDVIPALGKGIEYVTEGVKNFISSIREAASTLADMVVPDWLEMHSPPPLAQALDMSASAASRATKGLANMQRQMITSSGAAHDFVDSLDMGGIATELGGHGTAWKNWRRILKQNIGANMGALAEGMSPGEILGQVGNVAAQWNLPPGMVTDLAQANGLVEHLTDTFAVFERQMRIENLGNMTQMAGSFSSLGSSFADMLTNMMAGGEAAKKTATDYRKLTETLGGQESQLATLKEELALLVTAEEQDTSVIKQKEKAIDDLTKSMDKNRESLLKTAEGYKQLQAEAFDLFSGNQNESQRIESELATIALLQDFLASGAESFLIPADAVSQAAGITGILYDQISGQQELNRLLAEQAEREELITRQKEAQQKLDFLKSQLDLIKLGESLGGDIFQGITFGLDASVEDLLAATNAVVEAMVGQIDADLQLGSPSRLMMSMFGDAMAGATLGVQKGAGALEYAFNASLSPFLNAGKMLAPSTNSYGNTNNNYFNMNVNTGANASAVIRQYEVARSTL